MFIITAFTLTKRAQGQIHILMHTHSLVFLVSLVLKLISSIGGLVLKEHG